MGCVSSEGLGQELNLIVFHQAARFNRDHIKIIKIKPAVLRVNTEIRVVNSVDTAADESPQNSPVTVLVPASLGLQILQRHIGWLWGLTPPIQTVSTLLHSSAASEPLHRLALPLRSVPPSRIVGDGLSPAS
jgi:hypothetical protein